MKSVGPNAARMAIHPLLFGLRVLQLFSFPTSWRCLPSLFTTDLFLGNKKLKRNLHDFFSRPSASSTIIDGQLEGTKLANNTDYGFLEIGMDVEIFVGHCSGYGSTCGYCYPK
jgi:hypothetical protein